MKLELDNLGKEEKERVLRNMTQFGIKEPEAHLDTLVKRVGEKRSMSQAQLDNMKTPSH